MSQHVEVTGEGNRVIVMGGGSLRVGASSIEVTGEDNRVVIASGGTLTIGGQQPQQPQKPPHVRRGQTWQHGIIARRYKVISVRDNTARCLVTDVAGEPITDGGGKATIEDISAINLRYAYHLVSG